MSNKKIDKVENNVKILSVNKIIQLLKTVKKNYPEIYHIILTILTTGMFMGEALALTWDDVAFSTNEITINKTLLYNKPSYYSPASSRKVDCPKYLMEVLREHKKNQNTKSNIVFSNKNGRYVLAGYSYYKKFSNILNLIGLKGYSISDLRDTYIFILIQSGMPLNHIQKLVGHVDLNSITTRFKHLIIKKPLDEVFSFLK